MRRKKQPRGVQASSQGPNGDADDASGPKPERERDDEARLGSPRVITLSGPISTEMVEAAAAQLAGMNAESGTLPIMVQILSHGGHLQAGWALYDLFSTSSAPVVTVAFGYVGSAAMVAYQGGSFRLIARHARLMIHTVTTGMDGERLYLAKELKERAEEIDKTQAELCRMLSRRSGQPMAVIRAWCEKSSQEFGAREAVKAGFADRVLNGRRLVRPKKLRR